MNENEIGGEFASLGDDLYARRYTPGVYQPAPARGGEAYRAAVGSIDYLVVSMNLAIAWRVESGAVTMIPREEAPDPLQWDWVRGAWDAAGVEVQITS